MPQGFSIQIPNLPNLTGMIRGLVSDLEAKINNEIFATGNQIRNKAIRNITKQKIVDQGIMRAGMQLTALHNGVQVFNSTLYSPFMEFGTKGRVQVPLEWSAYARSFKGPVKRGTLDDFESNLIDWLKRKKIVPKTGTGPSDYKSLARTMMAHILRYGLKPRPFFYPAYKEEADKLPERVLKLIMREMRFT